MAVPGASPVCLDRIASLFLKGGRCAVLFESVVVPLFDNAPGWGWAQSRRLVGKPESALQASFD
jgi:hypothetical protein